MHKKHFRLYGICADFTEAMSQEKLKLTECQCFRGVGRTTSQMSLGVEQDSDSWRLITGIVSAVSSETGPALSRGRPSETGPALSRGRPSETGPALSRGRSSETGPALLRGRRTASGHTTSLSLPFSGIRSRLSSLTYMSYSRSYTSTAHFAFIWKASVAARRTSAFLSTSIPR